MAAVSYHLKLLNTSDSFGLNLESGSAVCGVSGFELTAGSVSSFLSLQGLPGSK